MQYNFNQLITEDGVDNQYYRKPVLIIIAWTIILSIRLGVVLTKIPNNIILSIFIYLVAVCLSGIVIMLIAILIHQRKMIKIFYNPMNEMVYAYQENHDVHNLIDGLLSLSHIKPGSKAWAVWKLNFATALIDIGEMKQAEKFLVSIIGINSELDTLIQEQYERLE